MILSLGKVEQGLLKIIFNFTKSKNIKLYLVGGILRDILLKREKENLDIDFCVKRKAITLGRELAKVLRAGFVILDKEHGACRLVKRLKHKTCTLDFTDFRGKTLADDLGHRDFTINTLALELGSIFNYPNLNALLIDPYQARRDLKSRVIRVANKQAFDEDPLRILRAFSLACVFNFKIEPETLRLIKLKKRKLAGVSFERIRDELFKIFHQPNAFEYLVKMDKLSLLNIIMPELKTMRNLKQGPYHHLDVWQHSLETVRQLEGLIAELKNNPEISSYLNAVISPERKRYALLKLGALLHDIGKPKALRRREGKLTFYSHEKIGLEFSENIVKRLKLSNVEWDSLKKLVFFHLRPGYLADNEIVSPRAIFRYFRDTANEAVSILLISLADQRATKGRLTTKKSRQRHERISFGLIKEYFKRKKEKKLKRIINGDDLIKKFKLEPSPLIGKILREIDELQAIGKVKTKQDAFRVAKRFINESTI